MWMHGPFFHTNLQAGSDAELNTSCIGFDNTYKLKHILTLLSNMSIWNMKEILF